MFAQLVLKKQEIDEENLNSDREKVYFSLSMMKGGTRDDVSNMKTSSNKKEGSGIFGIERVVGCGSCGKMDRSGR